MVGYAKYCWVFPTFEHRANVFMWWVDDLSMRFLHEFKHVVFFFLVSLLTPSSGGSPLSAFSLRGAFYRPTFRPPVLALHAHLPWVWGWGAVTRIRTRGPGSGLLGAREFRLPHACRREAACLLSSFTSLVRGPFRADTPVDLTAVDRLGLASACGGRFLLWYFLATHRPAARFAVTVPCPEGVSVPSLTPLHPAWGWPEREVWDMFGVRFYPHPDLRRILTDYAFRGFPLRKDFPVVGFKQVRYDEGFSAVVYENLFLVQDEREALLVNPWLSSRAAKLPLRFVLRDLLFRVTRRANIRWQVLFARALRRADPNWKFTVGYAHRLRPLRDHYGTYVEPDADLPEWLAGWERQLSPSDLATFLEEWQRRQL